MAHKAVTVGFYQYQKDEQGKSTAMEIDVLLQTVLDQYSEWSLVATVPLTFGEINGRSGETVGVVLIFSR
jgi:hypothetical protein